MWKEMSSMHFHEYILFTMDKNRRFVTKMYCWYFQLKILEYKRNKYVRDNKSKNICTSKLACIFYILIKAKNCSRLYEHYIKGMK